MSLKIIISIIVIIIIISIVLLTRTTVANPNLANGIEWQEKCKNCSDLVWASVGAAPWNKYYQVSCMDGSGNESNKSDIYGPVVNNNFNHPKIRLQLDGVNPCGTNNVAVYRGNDKTNLSRIYPKDFGATNPYNGRDAIFTDI